MKNKTLITALSLVSFLLTACSGIMDSAQPTRQYYMLSPVSGPVDVSGSLSGPGLSISVSAVPGLDTDRVQALSSDARLNQYANARWPDHLPEVLTSVMKRSLASSGNFSSVTESGRASDDGWLLQLEVQQFYGIQNTPGNTSSVVIEMSGSMECNGHRGSFTLSDSNSVGEERLSSVVAAHQEGLDNVTRQILSQISDSCP